jgi:uncharacterized protein (TIGR02268 family)
VAFADGAAPESVTVEFIGHPGRAPREVEVYRHTRTLKSYQEEAQQAREHAQRLQQQLDQVLAQGRGHMDLLELLFGGGMALPRQGVPLRSLGEVIQNTASSVLSPRNAYSYSFTTLPPEKGEEVVQVVLELWLKNPGPEPWLAAPEAVLVGAGKFVKEARVRQPVPILPDTDAVVYVAAELTVAEARGVFVLRLWDTTGARRVTLQRVSFP